MLDWAQLRLLALYVLAGTSFATAEQGLGHISHPVEGKVRLPGSTAYRAVVSLLSSVSFCPLNLFCAVFADKSIKSSRIKLILSVNGGSQLQAFTTTDGSFSFSAVPAGTHMLDVISVDLLFPQVCSMMGCLCWPQLAVLLVFK